MPLVAVLQLNCGADIDENLAAVDRLARRAAAAGAALVATPEATTYLGPHARKAEVAEPLDGPTHRRLGALARELGIHLLVGGVVERSRDPARPHNTSVLFGPDGAVVAAYRKLHLFDVDLSAEGGVRFRESETTLPGDEVVVAPSPVGPLGLTICYDLRFAELYRALADRGATAIAVPSAFTLMTGKDHWIPLLRARAIETQCWVLAPAQWGPHGDRGLRRSYGHAAIVDPWGTVVARCPDGVGLALAEVDPARAERVRRQLPVRAHRRFGPPPGPRRAGG